MSSSGLPHLKEKCIWPKTEAHHDFADSDLFSRSYFNNCPNLKNILGLDVGSCSDSVGNLDLVDDEKIVLKVFIKGKNEFQTMEPGWHDISVNYKIRGGEDEKKNTLEEKKIKLFKIIKDESKNYTGLLGDVSKNMFRHIKPDKDGNNHVFFIQDVAGDVVKQLKYINKGTKKNYIHIINSVETIGDSASKIKPDCKKKYIYKKNPPSDSKVRLFSWLHTKNREIKKYDELMMSSYKIKTEYAKSNYIQRWMVDQVWNYKDEENYNEENYNYSDINKTNNRTSIKEEILGLTNSLWNTNLGHDEKRIISRALQRKRSGDYLQIKFTKDFPTLITSNDNSDFQLILPDKEQLTLLQNSQDYGWVYPNENSQLYKFISDKFTDFNKDTIKQNSFIVTNDWPCLSYAIFNQVNVIFHNNSPTCRYLLVFQFHFNEEYISN